MISQDYVIKGSSGFIGASLHLARLGGLRHCVSASMFLIYHVLSLEHVFKWECDFMDGNTFALFTTLPRSVAI